MKYIIALALILGLVSCQPEMFNGNGKASDAEMVELTFSVQFPEPIPIATKGKMGEGLINTPSDSLSLHLCIFGSGNGYVQNWIEAEKTETYTNTSGYVTGGEFKVLLPVADDERTIHIIANPPMDAVPTTSDYLDNVMEKMVNGQDSCSYWQQIVVEKIDALEGSSTNPPKASEYVTTAFRNIHLLRNFAKFIVTSPETTDEDYESIMVKRWTLINVPTRGYVAPYTKDQTKRFPDGYLNAFLKSNPTGSQLYNQLVNIDEYPGSMPGTASINETFPGNPETTTGAYVNRGQAQYMYERPKPEDPYKQTAVLVEIEIQPTNEQLYDPRPGANNTYWYKIEVLDDNGSYVPFLRNIVYTLRIKGLEDYGATTAQAAFDGPYFGNISASLETAGLSDLSNGTSAIHVDQLDYTFMTLTEAELESGFDLTNPDGSPSLFYFTPDVEHPDQIFFEDVENVVDVTVTKRAVTGFAHAVANFTTLPAGNDAGKIHITPAEIDVANGTMKKSVLRVAGKALPDGKELYREITITLMPKPDLKYGTGEEAIWTDILYGEGLTPADVSGVNKDVYLRICLPVGLGASLFPIQIRIEAENNTLTSTSPKLPVRTGKTMFEPAPAPGQPDTRRNTYFFVYTINYSDYCKLDPRTKKYVYKYKFGETADDRIILKTSTSGSNATRISISDLEGHFNEKILDLTSTP